MKEISEFSQLPHINCRACEAPLRQTFVDLGMTPLANAYIQDTQSQAPEVFYPLHAYVCEQCFLVQIGAFESAAHLFSDYAYFSSFSDSWLSHCQIYAAQMVTRFQLNAQSQVIELASNDGYLLQYFQQAGIPILGVEPAGNIAQVAIEKDIPTLNCFFTAATAQDMRQQGYQADLLVANNVLAHVHQLNDFVAGMQRVLKPEGVITAEFPHLLHLIRQNQFDTIYHEHFSYFSLYALQPVFEKAGLTLFDAEALPTHGGSLRIYAAHTNAKQAQVISSCLGNILAEEKAAGIDQLDIYQDFSHRIQVVKRQFVRALLDIQEAGKTIAGYGAPAKGNTLLNYCGIGPDLLPFTVDRSPHKQNRRLPGSRIPIGHPDQLIAAKPDYVLILPWNLQDEVMAFLPEIREWGGQFMVAIPETRCLF